MKLFLIVLLLVPQWLSGQHEHGTTGGGSHLSHILASRKQTSYISDLPPPLIMAGIGKSELTIQTSSPETQQFFNQGVALLHCFWDLEAYRAFKEAIRHDSSAIMPYWGLLETIGSSDREEYKHDKAFAIKKLNALKSKANEHEKLYAEGILLRDSPSDGNRQYNKKLEQIVHKFPDDVDARLFLALKKMAGFDADMNPYEGQLFSEYLLRDVLRSHPDNAGAHHYWIHQMENCCPEQALQSAERLSSLAPGSGHIVHMPGHIYYKLGDYKKAYDAFIASMKVDSAYMVKHGIEEVDNWNFIHNLNYLLANCAEDARYTEGLYYAGKLERMAVNKGRKNIYDKMFFYQGVLAPAKMEMRFAFWDRAATRLDAIQDNDSIYGGKAMAYKEALSLFCKGMEALQKDRVNESISYSRQLDSFLWRTMHQTDGADALGGRNVSELNIASLELQGCIKSAEHKYEEALALLEKAQKKEKEFGYTEPPSYARPIFLSIAAAHERAGEFEQAIATYESLLAMRPNSANAYLGLAKIYRKMGQAEKANEFERKLMVATMYGDRAVYALPGRRKDSSSKKQTQ